MSVSRSVPALLCGFMLSMPVLATEAELPDAEFLEYLGMWEESDEDWLLVDEETMAENDERTDPDPEGEESVEDRDES